MSKRTNTRRADGLISVQIYLGKDSAGKRKYKTVYGRTQRDANAAAEEFKARLRKGMDTDHDRDTFLKWRQRWFAIKQQDIGASQITSYKSMFKHLKPLDDMPIRDIRPYHVQDIITELAAGNPKTGRPTAKKTLTDIKNTAAQVFRFAVENRALEFNPADAVRVPKNAPKETRRALNDREKEWIRTTPHRMQTAAMIMLYAGLRRGEVIPLLWSDIDLAAGTISVTKAVDLKDGEDGLKSTKTEAGTRTVYMPKLLTTYLSQQKRDTLLVCPTAHGTMYTASSWKATWRSYLIALDIASGVHPQKKSKYDKKNKGIVIDNITPHMLRHTACTMMIESGMDPSTVQRQMGHADVRTTLSIYTHVTDQHRQKEIAKMDEYLTGASSVQVVNLQSR